MSTRFAVEDEEESGNRLSRQALSFFLHVLFALGAWAVLMVAGYAVQPASASQIVILLLSIAIPLVAGVIIARVRPDEMAPQVWLAGLIWVLVVCLWIIDLPTGPNACNECGATEKLTRTLLSFPSPSGLIDNNGPFLCTWPAAALIGYSLGARIALRMRKLPPSQD